MRWHLAKVPSTSRLVTESTRLLLAMLLAMSAGPLWGCARDTDTLICAPGREVVGGVCADIIEEADVYCVSDAYYGEPEALSPVDATCTSWSVCKADLICVVPGPEGIGRCTLRCDAEGATPCDESSCSSAGLCLQHGSLSAGDDCSGAERCAMGLACALEDGRCHAVCDPRTAEEERCADAQACIPRASGLGLCFPSCD